MIKFRHPLLKTLQKRLLFTIGNSTITVNNTPLYAKLNQAEGVSPCYTF